jgi:hypothetical protein
VIINEIVTIIILKNIYDTCITKQFLINSNTIIIVIINII